MGEGELPYARTPERYCTTWYRTEDFADRHGIRWHELPCDHDVFGDGAVTVLSMPGHSPGSLAAMVRLPESTYILTGDVVHTRAGLDGEVAYPGDVDTVAARRSLRKLIHLAQIHAAHVWINHDPDDWERYGGSGEGAEHCPLGVRWLMRMSSRRRADNQAVDRQEGATPCPLPSRGSW